MDKVLYYLEMKNNLYGKLHQMTLKQLEKSLDGNWDGLELFVENRERILNMLRSYDFKVAMAFEKVQGMGAELNAFSEPVKELMDARKDWSDKIVALDLQLMSRLEDLKNETIKDLKKTVETQHQVQAFTAPSQKKQIQT